MDVCTNCGKVIRYGGPPCCGGGASRIKRENAMAKRLDDMERRIDNLETLLNRTVRAMESMTEVLEKFS